MKALAISAISLMSLIAWPEWSSCRHCAQIGRKLSAQDFSKQMKINSNDWCFFSRFEHVNVHFIFGPAVVLLLLLLLFVVLNVGGGGES